MSLREGEEIWKISIEHLHRFRPEWEKWTLLKEHVNLHLKKVVDTWTELESFAKKNLDEKCPMLKEKTEDPSPVNTYSLRQIVLVMWKDAEKYPFNGEHKWDNPSNSELASPPNNYRIHEPNVFLTGEGSLNGFLECLTSIFDGSQIAAKRKALEDDRVNIEKECDEFEKFLNGIQDNYERGEGIPHTCPKYENTRTKLNQLTAPTTSTTD